jgi:membrane protein YqaA with SNARE-associated domain
MSLVSLAVVAFVGTVFWAASPEAATALVGAQHRASPLLVGIVAAGGQGAALIGLYCFGEQLRRRWRWFDAKCARARVHSRLGSERTATGVAVAAGLFGFPPVSVTAALIPGVAPRPLRLLPLVLVLRLVRFTALAWAASLFGWHLPW